MCKPWRNGTEDNYHRKIFALLQELIEKVDESFENIYQEQAEVTQKLECIEHKLKKITQKLHSLELVLINRAESDESEHDCDDMHGRCD